MASSSWKTTTWERRIVGQSRHHFTGKRSDQCDRTDEDVEPVIAFLGRIEPEISLGSDRVHYDNRRIFLSNSKLFGCRIGDLRLIEDTRHSLRVSGVVVS